jgi:hypothetical protein
LSGPFRTKQGKTIPNIPKNVVITVVVKITQNDGVVMAILVSVSKIDVEIICQFLKI